MGFSLQEPPTRQDIQTVGWGAAYPFPLDLPILKSTLSSAPTQKALAEQDNMFRLGLAAQLCYLQHWYFDSPRAHFPRTGSPQTQYALLKSWRCSSRTLFVLCSCTCISFGYDGFWPLDHHSAGYASHFCWSPALSVIRHTRDTSFFNHLLNTYYIYIIYIQLNTFVGSQPANTTLKICNLGTIAGRSLPRKMRTVGRGWIRRGVLKMSEHIILSPSERNTYNLQVSGNTITPGWKR